MMHGVLIVESKAESPDPQNGALAVPETPGRAVRMQYAAEKKS